MSKAIMFIPRSPFLDSDRVMPFLGPLYLKSFLESKGHEISINDDSDLENLPNLEKFDVVGISTTTPQYYVSKGGREIAKKIREKYPHKKLLIGGAHAKNYFQETIEDKLFDNIIRGDGEMAFLDVLEGKNLPKVISYPPLNKEQINSFPIPWREKEYLEKYNYFIGGKRATTAMTARYCPMSCKFCEERDSKIVLYNQENVDRDLQSIKDCGFDALMFYDDILPLNTKRTKELCDVIKNHNLLFRCNGHAKIMSKNKEVIKQLADSGCVEVCLGIESADQKILNTIDKKNSVKEIFDATENVLNENLKLSAYLMIGLPGESKETIQNTERYISKFANNPFFSFDYTIFYPYRHTYIRENMEEFDLRIHLEGSTGAYKQSKGMSECCVSTSSLSRKEIIEERERIIKKYRERFRGA